MKERKNISTMTKLEQENLLMDIILFPHEREAAAMDGIDLSITVVNYQPEDGREIKKVIFHLIQVWSKALHVIHNGQLYELDLMLAEINQATQKATPTTYLDFYHYPTIKWTKSKKLNTLKKWLGGF